MDSAQWLADRNYPVNHATVLAAATAQDFPDEVSGHPDVRAAFLRGASVEDIERAIANVTSSTAAPETEAADDDGELTASEEDTLTRLLAKAGLRLADSFDGPDYPGMGQPVSSFTSAPGRLPPVDHRTHHGDGSKLDELQHEMELVIMDLSALTSAVAADTAVESSAITLIQQIAAQLAANSGDQVAVSALADQLNSSASALAAAVTANTPAATA